MKRKLTFLSLIGLFFLASCGEQPASEPDAVPSADSTENNAQVIQEIDQLLQSTERIRLQLDRAIQETENN
jgi:hypothetical protein